MKLLYIEDDRINRIVLSKLLAPFAEVEVAANGEEAVQMGQHSDYDVFLIDIHLGDPNMDGIKTMHQLREREANSKAVFVALTAYAMKEDREKFLREGFDYHHPKPVDVDKLVKEMNREV